VKRPQRERKQGEDHASQLRHKKKEHINGFDEESNSEYGNIPIYGKFTRPVGIYRRGYKRPSE
jgi:hypothetical protein